jgi:uncharacterized protein YqhQ
VAAVVPGFLAARRQVGGQAVIEGVMMRGVSHWSVAVRRPDSSIALHFWSLRSLMQRYPVLKLPFLRGMVALGESLVLGIRALTISANESLGEEQEPLGKKEMAFTITLAVVLAVGLFFLAPLGLTRLFRDQLGTGMLFWLAEGVIRVLIFLLYLVFITRIPDLRRVFEYHGAEHMTIHALEHGEELSPENCAKYATVHVRCGTSFLLIVMVVSILVFAVVRWPAWYWLILSRILLVPVIVAISYEAVRLAGRFERNVLVRVIMAPGLLLQRMTTRTPDRGQIEVAIEALRKIVELEPQQQPSEKGVEVMA